MTGYRTRWARAEETADDSERIAIREALAFGKALYDVLPNSASASRNSPLAPR